MSLLAEATTRLPASRNYCGEARNTRSLYLGVVDLTAQESLNTFALSEAFSYFSRVSMAIQGKMISMPFSVEVRITPTYVSVTDLRYGIMGVGNSLEEAREDFRSALIEYREVLSGEPNLSPELRNLLAHLVSIY